MDNDTDTQRATMSDRWDCVLHERGACREALTFAVQYADFQSAWAACERGDWLLWWIGRAAGKPDNDTRRRLARVACQCARLALPYVQDRESRPLHAIETAERWASGDTGVTLDDKRKAAHAADAASAAASAACAACAAYAARAAATAAYAATAADTATAAYVATRAAHAACAAYAASAAARTDVLRQCADIVRAEYPTPPAHEVS